MLKRDNVWLGAVLGLVLPAIAYLLVEVLKSKVKALEKDDLLYIGCVALNLLLVRYYFREYKENTARGIIAATFVCAFVFFYHKMKQ
ncbi:MAG: stationary phase survival protein SurE [Sphingobacteriaceae bacterium]|nr:stationary phase survival protein SurE [Sphingobacteriaceae bacterium]